MTTKLELWYDTKEGISKSIETLDGLNSLITERNIAAGQRSERLNEFYVLGAFHLDSEGGCLVISEKRVWGDYFDDIPKVLENRAFWEYIGDSYYRYDVDHRSFSSMTDNLPTSSLRCPHCNNGWSIDNYRDVSIKDDIKKVLLSDYLGKTLREVKDELKKKDGVVCYLDSSLKIQNDRLIDTTPKDQSSFDVKNPRGFLCEKNGLTDDYIIQAGDVIWYFISVYLHKGCKDPYLVQAEKDKFEKLFVEAGFKDISMIEIRNEYCSIKSDHHLPWYRVKTELGTIKIGWRKRVIKIDWSMVNSPPEDVLSLFSDENVTKCDDYIHAWSYEKAQEYLSRIYNLFKQL